VGVLSAGQFSGLLIFGHGENDSLWLPFVAFIGSKLWTCSVNYCHSCCLSPNMRIFGWLVFDVLVFLVLEWNLHLLFWIK
jgi:hypothetical protein